VHDAILGPILDEVATALARAKRALFVTGAGLSADSGLPTYRGMGGLYDGMATAEGMPIERVLSGHTFRSKPELTWKYLREVARACEKATFNAGHRMITEHLLKTWRVAERVVSGKAARAQEYLCGLPQQFEAVAERMETTLATQPRFPFSWIYDHTA